MGTFPPVNPMEAAANGVLGVPEAYAFTATVIPGKSGAGCEMVTAPEGSASPTPLAGTFVVPAVASAFSG